MLSNDQASNTRCFFRLVSTKLGFSLEKVQKPQAFYFIGGQGAQTGFDLHLPADKVKKEIAKVTGL